MELNDLIREMIKAWSEYKKRDIKIDEKKLIIQTQIAERIWKEVNGKKGKLIIVQAPTGFGKTEIIVSTFLYQWIKQKWFAGRMFLVEPVHALLRQIYKRTKIYQEKIVPDLGVGEDHGEVVYKTFLYTTPITLTTVDALVYGYLAQRVNTWVRKDVRTGRYSFPVGILMNSFLVFDEAHLIQDEVFLAPRVLAKIICSLVDAGAIVLFSTATLPSEILNYFSCEEKPVLIKQSEERTQPKIDIDNFKNGNSLTPEKIECNGRTLVVVNTVKKAREIYSYLKGKYDHVFILHSLMTNEDRTNTINKIDDLDKNKKEFLLVGTQATEVGLDYSFDTLYTETAPIDSLIQRIGRIGRQGNASIAKLYYTDKSAPYEDIVILHTSNVIGELVSTELGDIDQITKIIDKVYGKVVIERLSEKGKKFYLKTIEYLENLHLFAYPPDETVFLRPSFYVTLYVVDESSLKKENENYFIDKKDLEKKSLKYSISLADDSNKIRLQKLLFGVCNYYVPKPSEDTLRLDERKFDGGFAFTKDSVIIIVGTDYYDEAGLIVEKIDEIDLSKVKKGKRVT